MSFVGQSVERVEDAALLTGRGRYIDDVGVPPRTLHAAVLRSPYPHAVIRAIDTDAARAAKGVVAVVTAADVTALGAPLLAGVKANIQCWPIAVERVRYVGEPVAVVVAADRYLAEDALELIEVDYAPLPVTLRPADALDPVSAVLHDGLGSNIASDRSFRYGDPETAFARAAHRVSVAVDYPRNSCTPIETYGLIADYDPGEDAYDVLATFQGPFSIHAVLARALKVPGNRLRLRTPPDSGGSFGVKQGIFPYIALMGIAARVAGRPVKWIEDRLEHLTASVSATNRLIRLDAAVEADGRVTALAWDQIEDVGAHIRAPEPATLYRMHGNLTGAYDVKNVSVRNRVVMTNKTPTGLNRGFGGPQVYYALERLMQRIAVELALDPLDVIRRNLVSGPFPFRTATGGLLDSGDYPACVEQAVEQGGLAELRARQQQARAEGRCYGIGLAAVVEPSVSNMGYITTVLTPEERRKAGPKNGAQATATIALDPGGAVSVHVSSVPQGQGHRTVAAQIVADALGLKMSDIRVVTDMDTARDAWSIASGNYASRFAPAVCGAVQLAAERIKAKLARAAAAQLNVPADEIEFAQGRVRARGNPDNALPFGRLAAAAHWAPGTLSEDDQALRETVFWTPPQLTAPTAEDGINSSLCHGFIFDFCGVEVDRVTGAVRIDKYVTMHDCGRVLHPGMVAGQVTGGFAHALGAALYEEYVYADDGSFISGTLADYLMPTTTEVPAPLILHFESPSPFTPLGSKGVGEGNCMSTPVCIANAVADALGVVSIDLPLTPAKLAALVRDMKPAPFDYLRAGTLAEAHAVLAAEGGDAAVIAGGQSLVPLLSMRMARPRVVVDIMHVGALGGIAIENGAIRVGAAVRQAELLAWPGLGAQPLLAQALPWIGHAQTRARGTVCGSVALADPSAELPLVLIALGGDIVLSSGTCRRSVKADDFFTGLMSTARRDDELIEAVTFPCARPGEAFAFREFARRHGDFAIVACAAIAGREKVRLAVGGVADRPVVREFPDAGFDAALRDFAAALDARDDLHATADYRRMLVRKLGAQTIAEAQACRA